MISDCFALGRGLGMTREEVISQLQKVLAQMSEMGIEDTGSRQP
jgi:hypothetical protein